MGGQKRVFTEDGEAVQPVVIIDREGDILDVNAPPNITDEFGNISSALGDNMFKGAIIAIPPEHHEIHCGDSYEFSHLADLGNGDVLDILVIVPNEGLTETQPGLEQDVKQYHFKGQVDVESECTIEFFEAATVSANGTAIDVFNRNRNATYTDYLGVYHTPTVTGTGTRLEIHKAGSGRSSGGIAGRADEWILKDNTIYLLRVTNDTTATCYVDVHANYYVHPGI